MLFLEDLRLDIRGSGDYRSDPHIQDQDLNFWINQGLSRVWVEIASLGNSQYTKDVDPAPALELDDKRENYYITLPQDYLSLNKLEIKKSGYAAIVERSSVLRSGFKSKYNQNDVVILNYYPDSVELVENADAENQPPFIIPKFYKYFLIDYAIKRARMKQDKTIGEIELESVKGYADIINHARDRDNHSPPVPRPPTDSPYYSGGYNEDIGYRYYPLGTRIYL